VISAVDAQLALPATVMREYRLASAAQQAVEADGRTSSRSGPSSLSPVRVARARLSLPASQRFADAAAAEQRYVRQIDSEGAPPALEEAQT
jgi:hypothetical protein